MQRAERALLKLGSRYMVCTVLDRIPAMMGNKTDVQHTAAQPPVADSRRQR